MTLSVDLVVPEKRKKVEVDTSKVYDVIVLGGGTAALGAALYAARYELSTLLITKEVGGAIMDADIIENYLGFSSIKGPELVKQFRSHVEKFNVPILEGREITALTKDSNSDAFIVHTSLNEEFKAKTIIVATGTRRRKLGLPKEEELTGRGVNYCVTCDAPFYKGKIVGVVGGGDAAITGATQLARVAEKVYVFVRSTIKAEPINQEALKPYIDSGKVEIIMPVTVEELLGEEKLEGVKLSNGATVKLDGLFIEIGGVPNTEFLSSLNIETDSHGHIIVDSYMRTNIPGIFAAGDVTNHIVKQCITAAAEGAVAAFSAYEFLRKKGANNESKS